MSKFTLHTYQAGEQDVMSVYVLTNSTFDIDEAIEFVEEEHAKQCDLVEEQDEAVANYLGYKYCVIFHETT